MYLRFLKIMNSYEDNRPCDTPSAANGQARWWETAEDHRFALEVLQLRLRRKILKFISCKMRTLGEIKEEFSLSTFLGGISSLHVSEGPGNRRD